MHVLILDHFSSVIFRHDIVCLQLQGGIVKSLYHVSRLKLISLIVSHGQVDGPYQMLRCCQCAVLSPEASQIVYSFFKRLSDVKLEGRCKHNAVFNFVSLKRITAPPYESVSLLKLGPSLLYTHAVLDTCVVTAFLF